MSGGLDLLSKCRINENGDGDRFVGIKADSKNQRVFFPMGYNLPATEEEIRSDIIQLIAVLSEFSEVRDRVLQMEEFERPQSVDCPIAAYMNIIRYHMDNGYYKERIVKKRTSDHGKMDFKTSLHRNVSFFQEDGSPFFANGYTVSSTETTEDAYITRVHKYCVYEAYKQLGWLFTPGVPQDPHIELERDKFLDVLNRKLKNTNNSDEKLLFKDMIKLIEFLDDPENHNQFYFGTDRFEYVWERLIDAVFGVKNKEDYFPRTRWKLVGGMNRTNYALEPDTIMVCDGKIYVLDAKYYRYGVSAIPAHLPESSSINKQITYGEYIHEQQRFKDQYGEDVPVFNAFLMPYNRESNKLGVSGYYANIGEATGDWKTGQHDYERVQGMVVDIRFLMHNFHGGNANKIRKMAEAIDQALAANSEE